MTTQPARESVRPSFTIVAHPLPAGAWHLTVVELPETWTVAFSSDEMSERARQRIAMDLGLEPEDFDVVVEAALFPGRSGRRDH